MISFSKYHGSGNDFIMIDSRKNVMTVRSKTIISRLCDRHFGIGADGLILLEESETHDYQMIYYNADGLPGTMCGNGGRCSAIFARECGLSGDKVVFEAADGLHTAQILSDGSVKLSLNDVPSSKRLTNGIFLDTGSPHLIRFVEKVENMDINQEGKILRHDNELPGGTNVNFVEPLENEIFVATFERGVEAETLSCGTGITASAIAASEEFSHINSPVEIISKGGRLRVEFERDKETGSYSNIFLTGPVQKVFSGIIDTEIN